MASAFIPVVETLAAVPDQPHLLEYCSALPSFLCLVSIFFLM